MTPEELKEELESGRLDNVSRLKYLKNDIEKICDVSIPTRVAEIDEWYDDNKAVISRKLNESTKDITEPTDSNTNNEDN